MAARADDEAEVAGAQRDLVDLGARRGAADRAHGRRRARSRRPRRRRSAPGRSMSASVTSRSSITKPPWSIRLWAMNWRMKSASAGPGQATQPSPIRKRRWRSRGSSASRSCSWSTKSSCWRSDFTGSSRRKPVRLIHAGQRAARRRRARRGTRRRGPATSSGSPSGSAPARVDRAAEGDQAGDALAAPVGRGLVAEHPALASSRRGGRRAPVASRTRSTASLTRERRGRRACARARPPRARARRSRPPTGRRRARAGPRRRWTPARRRRPRRASISGGTSRTGGAPAGVVGEVVAQAVDAPRGDDLVRRGLLAGLQAAEARDLERVLRGRAEAGCGLCDRIGYEADGETLVLTRLSVRCVDSAAVEQRMRLMANVSAEQVLAAARELGQEDSAAATSRRSSGSRSPTSRPASGARARTASSRRCATTRRTRATSS